MTAHSKNMSPHSHDTFEKPTQPDSTVGNYLICEKIGQGSFATVYKAQHKVSGHLAAIKSVSRSKLTKKLLENLESEISILKAIQHKHIVGLTGCRKTETHIHLIMDYCAMGDLSQYIKEIRSTNATRGPLGGLPEDTLRYFLRQLASALRFLRSRNLVHRDIKPQNLLLVSPQKTGGPSSSTSNLPILRVADFGFARFLPNASMADTLCGSPLYMGPEILSYQKYDAKADLWSVGAVLYEMMTGRPPFHAQNYLELLKIIQKTKDRIRFPDEKKADGRRMSDDLKDLIRKLLKQDPLDRLSFVEFFAHPAILPTTTPPVCSTLMRAPPISANHRFDIPDSDEAPPFAQSSSSPYQYARQTTPISPSPTIHTQPRHYKAVNDDNLSQAHSRGQSGKAVDFNDSRESKSTVRQATQRKEVEDVLHGYVVVEKPVIDTNQLAAGINNSQYDDNDEQYETQRQPTKQVAIQRRKSSSSSSSSLSAASSASNQTGPLPSSSSSNTPPFSVSCDKRISTGAFTKALTMVSERLFSAGHSPPDYSKTQRKTTGAPRGFLIMGASYHGDDDADNSPYIAGQYSGDNDDNKTMERIEKAACMGHAVATFADSKFDLLMSGCGGLMGIANEPTLAAEGLALHMKALALLELGLELAKGYWRRLQRHDRQQHETPSPRLSVTRLNDIVQWMRERFNECLDRASIEKLKCESSVESSSDSSPGINPCIAKLLYEKALEMSRAAAVHELVGENADECEQDYRTAIWMLKAILETGKDNVVAIEENDRKIINKFINSIQQRISVLQRKILYRNGQQFPIVDPILTKER